MLPLLSMPPFALSYHISLGCSCYRVIQQAEQFLPENCVFATNTSALPIRDIAKASKRPQNVVGMHYFSPVPMMPLLEVRATPYVGIHLHRESAAKPLRAALWIHLCIHLFMKGPQTLLYRAAEQVSRDCTRYYRTRRAVYAKAKAE